MRTRNWLKTEGYIIIPSRGEYIDGVVECSICHERLVWKHYKNPNNKYYHNATRHFQRKHKELYLRGTLAVKQYRAEYKEEYARGVHDNQVLCSQE